MKIIIFDKNRRKAAEKARKIREATGGHILYVRRAITGRARNDDGFGPEAA